MLLNTGIFDMEKTLMDRSLELLRNINLPESYAVIVQSILALILITIVAWLIDKLATKVFRTLAPRLTQISRNKWDDILIKNKIFANFSHFFPGMVFLILSPLISSQSIFNFINDFIGTYFIIVAMIFINSLINAAHDIYLRINAERAIKLNIKLFLQLIKVVIFSFGVLAIISLYTDKSFFQLLAGLGTMLTIILIVYKDTILGFIAGIKLTAYEMVRIGDWIQLPKENADGRVIDVSLNTVKVRNWDQTITTVPTYKLVSEPFTNWTGMEQSGGRQILRHINIDMESIRFLSEAEIEKFKRFKLLKTFIEEKTIDDTFEYPDIKDYLDTHQLTNIGLFRRYIEKYIQSTGFANTDMEYFVRQRQSTEKGLPLQIYVFVREKQLAKYERIQAEIFDHIFAIIPEFGLRIFQEPSGYDVSKLGESRKSI